jgi:hypothetical protein
VIWSRHRRTRLRHTPLCLFRRPRPLTLRRRFTARLPISALSARFFRHFPRSVNPHNSLAPWSGDSRRRPRRPRLLVPHPSPFVRFCLCLMRSGSNASYLPVFSPATVASSTRSLRPPALRSRSRCMSRLRIEGHPRRPLHHPDSASSSRRLCSHSEDTYPHEAARHEQDAPALGQRTSLPELAYMRATTIDMRRDAMSTTTTTSAAGRGAAQTSA